jgi:cholesterol oxidase
MLMEAPGEQCIGAGAGKHEGGPFPGFSARRGQGRGCSTRWHPRRDAIVPAVADTVRFSETLAGRLGRPDLPLEDAARQGDDTRFLLTVVTPDIAEMVADPHHRSPAWGCLLAPWLSPAPLGVTDGRLDLFVDGTPDRRVVHMLYRLDLRAVDGQRYVLLGKKELRRRRWFPTLAVDATTLRCTLHAGGDDGPLRAHGLLRQGLVSVLAQGATFRGSGRWGGVAAIVAFFRYYLGTIAGVYLRR